MSPSCRDETLAGLKVEQAKFGGKNLFTSKQCKVRHESQIHALLDKFSIKNYFISKIKSSNKTLLRKISVSTSIFVLNFSPADRAPRLSQVRSQLSGLARFPCKVKVFFI